MEWQTFAPDALAKHCNHGELVTVTAKREGYHHTVHWLPNISTISEAFPYTNHSSRHIPPPISMAPASYTIASEAYYQIFFHAAKHPHTPVNGV